MATIIHELSPISKILNEALMSSEELAGDKWHGLELAGFLGLTLDRKRIFLHKLLEEDTPKAVLDRVFTEWTGNQEAWKALVSLTRDLPWERIDYMSPFLRKAIDDKKLPENLRLKAAVMVLQPADINMVVIDPAKRTGAHYGRHHFSDGSREMGLVNKAKDYVEGSIKKLAPYQKELPQDHKTAADILIKAQEIAQIRSVQVDNQPIPIQDIGITHLDYGQQVLELWKTLTQEACSDNQALSRCWEIAREWMRAGDELQRRDFLAGWTLLSGMAKVPEELTPDYRPSMLVPANRRFSEVVETTISQINSQTLPVDLENKVKLFLKEVFSRDSSGYCILIATFIKRVFFEENGKNRHLAEKYLRLFHEAIDARIPTNLDQLLEILEKNEATFVTAIVYFGAEKNIVYFAAINYDASASKPHPTQFASGRITDENGDYFPVVCVDGESGRSHHYLAKYLNIDQTEISLTDAAQELDYLTAESSEENFGRVKRFLIALEKEVLLAQRYPPEEMAKLERLTPRIIPWSSLPEAIPILISFYHLGKGFIAEESISQLDKALGLDLQEIPDEETFFYIRFLSEIRRFIGFHFTSPGLRKLYDFGIEFMDKTAQKWTEKKEPLTPAVRLNEYLNTVRIISILKQANYWHTFEEAGDDFSDRYLKFIDQARVFASQLESIYTTEGGFRALIKAILSSWDSLTEKDKEYFLDTSLDHDGHFSQHWLNFAQMLDEMDFLELATKFFINDLDDQRKAALFHRLLILSDRDTNKEQLLVAKFLLVNEALAARGLYSHPELINLPEMVARLNAVAYFAYDNTGNKLVNLAVIKGVLTSVGWPLPPPSVTKVILKGEYLPPDKDDARLESKERISRYFRRSVTPEIAKRIGEIDTRSIIGKLVSPKIAENIPVDTTRLPLFEQEAGICDENHYPRVEIFAGQVNAVEKRVGVDGNLAIKVDEDSQNPAIFYLPFSVTTNGVQFVQRENLPLISKVIPADYYQTIENAILEKVELVITAEYAANTLMKIMADLPEVATGTDIYSGKEGSSKIRWGPQLHQLVEAIGERFVIIEEVPNMWIVDRKEIMITGDGWHWKEWSEVIDKKAGEFGILPRQYFAKLFEEGIKIVFIGRPVNKESYDESSDDAREVSRDPGAVTGFNYKDQEEAAIFLDRNNWQTPPRLVKLPDNRRPTRANIAQAEAYNHRIIIYDSLEALKNGGIREAFHRTTFRPPQLTAEAMIKVEEIRKRRPEAMRT